MIASASTLGAVYREQTERSMKDDTVLASYLLPNGPPNFRDVLLTCVALYILQFINLKKTKGRWPLPWGWFCRSLCRPRVPNLTAVELLETLIQPIVSVEKDLRGCTTLNISLTSLHAAVVYMSFKCQRNRAPALYRQMSAAS